MNNIKQYILGFSVFLNLMINVSCNKTKQHSKWLTGETWKVSEVTIDGNSFGLLPQFKFDECDIYDEICFGNLIVENTSMANFAWQIREKGSIFELSDQTQNVSESNEEAVSFSSSFSGIYDVNQMDKKSMELESNNCKRYPGKKVIIKLNKE